VRSWLLVCALALPACAASLSIVRPEVERVEDGHPVFPPEAFAGGELLHFSFYVEGFTRKENAVKLRFEAEAEDSEGAALAPGFQAEESSTLTAEDKDWKPKLRGKFQLPGVLSGGACRIRIQVKDELSGESAARELTFVVSGPKIAPSPSLAIRGLNFYRNDEEERPLDVAAFRASEEIHARFQLVGYRHNERNAIDVAYGISIADASGNVLFAEPSAAQDKSEDFYPKPYVPGILSFTLKPGTPAGSYTLTVKGVDRIGAQTTETQRSFVLE
jgi:hypothetical protein